MDTSTLILIMLPVFIFCLVMAVKHEKKKILKKTTKLEAIFGKIEEFHADKKILGLQSSYMLCFDNSKKQLFYTKGDNYRLLHYSDIIKVEMLEDNSLVMSKSALRTIGGGIIGGAVAGGAGAVIGGLSSSSKQKKMVSKVKVKILLRDISSPSLVITCFDSMLTDKKREVSIEGVSGIIYRQAREIIDIISVIIDKEDSQTQTEQTSASSLSDELLKLHELKEKGILTSDEFESQKCKLLS